jgi:hypothetical protein
VQFWGNLAGQATFAAGTVLVPGLVEGKLAGAAGELGDASQLLKAGTTLEDAAPAISDAAGVAEGAAAPVLPNPDALSFVPENSGVAQSPAGQAWRDYQPQTIGADTDPLTGQSNVPALQFDNPNANREPFVKWDGYQQLPDGTTELIDAKTAISPFSTADGPFVPQCTLDQLVNKSAALDQNPGYTGVIEVPTDQAAADAQAALDNLGITNIDVRVRPSEDAAPAVPDAAPAVPDAGAVDSPTAGFSTSVAPADVPDAAVASARRTRPPAGARRCRMPAALPVPSCWAPARWATRCHLRRSRPPPPMPPKLRRISLRARNRFTAPPMASIRTARSQRCRHRRWCHPAIPRSRRRNRSFLIR